ncbi:MAG: flavin reductase [Alphaproteobacteria bacterium]|nr:flavin reductase [Alphaproteobacteria bacterium]
MDEIRDQFIKAMSAAGTTVYVVTTDGTAGQHGVTVSAMSSVSADMDDPTLLVCIHHLSSAADAIMENKAFAVNMLRSDQSHISDVFAGRLSEAESKFSHLNWHKLKTGVPILSDALVSFDCNLYQVERVGTHYIFIGGVVSIHHPSEGDALVYSKRSYGRFQGIA